MSRERFKVATVTGFKIEPGHVHSAFALCVQLNRDFPQ